MGFVPYGEPVDVTLGVVAYGVTDRLTACLRSLLVHQSDLAFDVVCVVNPDTRVAVPDIGGLPRGIKVITPEANLGWAGGMHVARHASAASWLGWIQDDSELLPGWLDAQVAAAQAHPEGAAFGAVAVDATGRASGYSGGWVAPGTRVAAWNDSDPTRHGALPAAVEERGWITSKGMLVRLAAWDDVGGPCAKQFPLNHVDKEFSMHLRTHGWKLFVVPGANLSHLQSQSAPSIFRTFVAHWHDDDFDARWAEALVHSGAQDAAQVPHDCHRHDDISAVEREVLIEASRMVVPLGKFAARQLVEAVAARDAEAQGRRDDLAAVHATVSWRVTAPLRWVSGLVRKPANKN